MQTPVLRLFGSYEFFGKSIPGAVAMLGLISLFPEENFPSVFAGELINVAGLLVVLLITGLMVGEGVHTLAENIEKLFHWGARRMKGFFNYIRAWRNWRLDINTFRYTSEIEEKPLTKRNIIHAWNGTIEWVRRRYWGTYDSLVSHRILLGKVIEWNFYPAEKTARWVEGDRGRMYELFAKSYKDTFGDDIRKLDPSEVANQYPLVSGRLEANNNQGFRHFQAIYSFCRSMWVLFFIYTIVFADLVYWNLFFGSSVMKTEPIALAVLGPGIRDGVPILLGIGAIVFFDAAGTYKRHFIEYLISDFVTETS